MTSLAVNQHHITYENGALFFYCADTAWELFHKLTYKEACAYIDNRADKGFNVIQAVAVAELDGLHTPSFEGGLLPFKNLDTLEVNDDYFSHVRRVIEYADSRDIVVALVPMWGSYLVQNKDWGGKVKPLFDKAEKLEPFMRYLGQKMRGLSLIWMLGGDRSYTNAEDRCKIEVMARTLQEVKTSGQLITAHTQGGRSLWDMLEAPDYLDFVTWQSGHMGPYYPSWRTIESDYARLKVPVLDAEPCYEAHPIMNEYTWSQSCKGARFTDYEVRRSAYWSVFSGGAGITYGCYAVWQMHREEDVLKEIPESAASAYEGDKIPFYHQCLNFPGAFQIPYLRKFIESLPDVESYYPDNSLILSHNPTDANHVAALTNKQHDFIAVYCPTAQPLCVDVSCFGTNGFSIAWFDPRYGILNEMSSNISESQFLNITPPSRGGDFVLLLKRPGM